MDMVVLVAGALIATGEAGTAPTAEAPALKKIECYCTDRFGERRELGEKVCLDVGGRSFTARCEMSLNNPMWREVEDGCVTPLL